MHRLTRRSFIRRALGGVLGIVAAAYCPGLGDRDNDFISHRAFDPRDAER